ncbi:MULTISPECIES: ABC transporter ATP-binding protein [Nostocales]|uniref:ABC transporter ATP-binding protein n=2 Tax=Nostocales TaxID=1161 RepID=A0ABW8WDQ2_9CYAN|nr:ABC transporter ATP-binding protein [Tolypothrix bouteillei]
MSLTNYTHAPAKISTLHAVELTDVRRVFGKRAVLNGINLTIHQAEFVAVLGPSGTGKTTLLRLLSGLDRTDSGSVRVAANRSVVFQEPRLVLAKRVWENVVLGSQGRAARRDALQALEEVGLRNHADAWPKTLSGGEAQRVALARALVRQPSLLLLDEPFASLDALTRIKMYELVAQLWERHHPAVVLVTHDVDEAILLADRILVLANGSVNLDLTIDTDKPRDRADPAFAALRVRLLAELGVAPNHAKPPTEPIQNAVISNWRSDREI